MIRLRPTPLFFLITLFFGCQQLFAQNEPQRYWYIGGGPNGVRFEQPSNEPSLITKPGVAYGGEGSAIVTDAASGTLLFYTDGINVYDVNNAVMPNGGGLQGGANTNNPAVVLPVPGQPDQYYIITNDANYGTTTGTIRFSIVDMTLPGNSAFPETGNVTTKNQAIPGLTGQAEGMIVIPDPNGTDYWLITQMSDNDDYFVTHVEAGGLFTTTQVSGLGVDISAASFAYHEATGQLAVAPQSSNTDIAILNFDSATGALSFNQFVLNSGFSTSINQAIYDVAWSPSGQYLYYSVHGQPGVQANVRQFDTTNPLITMPSILPQPNTILQSYGLQVGPDGNIYHLYRNSSGDIVMGRIENTDSVAALTTYIPEVFPGTIFNATQFPSFSPEPEPNIVADFISQGTCSNTPTSFFPTITPNADSVRWDFGDGGVSTQLVPTYTYADGQPFQVTLTVFLNGDSVQVTHPVNITQFDLEITLVQDTTACSCELPFPKGDIPTPAPSCTPFSVTAQINGTPTSTEWFGPSGLLAGQNTATLTPDSIGYYYIKVSDATGCFAYAGVNIKEYDVPDQRANIWYFGNNAGLDFNPLPDNPVQETTNPVMNAPEGTATISDRNGQVIIFTDGETIWDRDFNILANGIGGDQNSSQSSIIVPVPGDETLYYIFTTQSVNNGGFEMNYSLFDLKVGTTGAVVQQDILLFSKSTERVTSTGNWLIAHEWGNNNFRAYPITPTGIGIPVISSAGSDHSFAPTENAEGYMKLGGAGLLAVAIPRPGANTVELFDFTDSSGVVSNPRVLDLGAVGEVYGIEFSPGGNKLFATVRNGGGSFIYEFAIDSLGEVTQLQSVPVAGDLGAMQIGPDGQIYIAVDGASNLLFFSANEDEDTPSPLAALQNFPLTLGTSTLGLPNFIQNLSSPIQGPSLAISGLCLGSPTDFAATGTDPIDVFAWDFGDGSPIDNNAETQHTYATTGIYNVSVTLTNRCGLDTTLTQTIEITAPPPNPTFVVAGDPVPITLCNGPRTLEALPASTPGIADLSFIWSTGATTRTIVASTQANYMVTIVDTLGCSSNGSVIVADPRPTVNLGPDRPFCQNDLSNPNFTLGTLPAGSTIAWAIDNTPTATTGPTQSISTITPGLFQYTVEVTNIIGSETCTAQDTAMITINPSPVLTPVIVTPTTTCGADDGSIAFDITGPPSRFTYSILGPTTFSVSNLEAPPNVVVNTGPILPASAYGIVVTDQVSGCLTSTTAMINDNVFTVTGLQDTNCDPIRIDVTTTAAVFPLDYRVINSITTIVEDVDVAATAAFKTVAPLPSNNQTYIVEVTDAGGCVQSSTPIVVNQDPKVPVTFTNDGCATPISVIATGGTGWTWTGPNITSATDQTSITATPPQGLQTYSVLVTQAGFCDLDTITQVLVDNNLTPLLSQSDLCADDVTVTATPTNAALYVYEWSRNGAVDPLLAGPQVIANGVTDGQQYSVRLYNNTSGCYHSSAALPVNVVGQVTVDFQPLPLICEDDDFTIIAIANKPVSTYDWSRNGTIINGQNSFSITQNQGGNYKVSVNFLGCPGENEILVEPLPKPRGNLPNVATICNDPENPNPDNQQVTLDVGPGYVSYQWSLNGSILPTEVTQSIIASEPGIYAVELESDMGCFGEDITRVEVDCVPDLFGPNAFRPGGLPENTEFYLFSFFINDDDFQIFIFNRWGEMVFQSDQKNFKWNGGYENNLGKPLPPGTYAWVAKFKSDYRPERGTIEKRGGVVLVR